MNGPCRLVSDGLKESISHAIDLTKCHNREHGFLVLENDGVFRTNIKRGNRTSIMMRVPSIFGLGIFTHRRLVGSFHTHPDIRLDKIPSVTDIRTMYSSGVEFSVIGYIENGLKRASVFTPGEFDTFNGLKVDMANNEFAGKDSVSEVRFAQESRERLHECTINLGSTGRGRCCEGCR